jgi:hypothetical protein
MPIAVVPPALHLDYQQPTGFLKSIAVSVCNNGEEAKI